MPVYGMDRQSAKGYAGSAYGHIGHVPRASRLRGPRACPAWHWKLERKKITKEKKAPKERKEKKQDLKTAKQKTGNCSQPSTYIYSFLFLFLIFIKAKGNKPLENNYILVQTAVL